MGFLSDLRESREIEALARAGEGPAARKRIEEIQRRHPRDPRVASLAALARSEAGDVAGALEAAAAARSGLAPAAARVLEAEVLLDAGRRAEARAALEEAKSSDPQAVAAPALLEVLALEDAGGAGAREAIGRLPPGALWCGPVLSRLVLALERAMEARARSGPPAPAFHEARSVLLRPPIESLGPRRFWVDGLRDLLGRGRPGAAAARAERQGLEEALGKRDLARAAEVLARGAELRRQGPAAGGARGKRKGRGDPHALLRMEVSFLLGRFEEVEEIRRGWIEGGGDAAEAYPAALGAYALIALGRPERALQVLAPARGAGPEAALFHLAAVAELALGKAAAAAGLLRRAAFRDDIGIVRVAQEEARFLGRGVEAREAPVERRTSAVDS